MTVSREILQKDFWLAYVYDSPVVLAVPHDGYLRMYLGGDFEKRVRGKKGRDKRSWIISRDISSESRSSVVRGLLQRPFCDYNRSSKRAVQDEELMRFYAAYHDMISTLISRALARYGSDGKCLFLDMHGFKNQPEFGEFDVILGTFHRETCPFGADVSLAHFLEGEGYRVYLPLEGRRHGERYWGGYTLRRHSDHFGGRIDAIQIEIAPWFRDKDSQESIERGKKLSGDVARFLRERA